MLNLVLVYLFRCACILASRWPVLLSLSCAAQQPALLSLRAWNELNAIGAIHDEAQVGNGFGVALPEHGVVSTFEYQ